MDRTDVESTLPQRARRGVARPGVAGAEKHGVAPFRQLAGHRQADSPVGAGYECRSCPYDRQIVLC
jgi:hypothetical protein